MPAELRESPTLNSFKKQLKKDSELKHDNLEDQRSFIRSSFNFRWDI